VSKLIQPCFFNVVGVKCMHSGYCEIVFRGTLQVIQHRNVCILHLAQCLHIECGYAKRSVFFVCIAGVVSVMILKGEAGLDSPACERIFWSVEKFSFITVLTRVNLYNVYWAACIQSITSQLFSVQYLSIFSHLCPSLPPVFRLKSCVRVSCLRFTPHSLITAP
jgi:hypothetical protein